MAEEPGPRGRQPAVIEAVAQAAGVSRQTVSNALNAPGRLRPATLARVLSTIEDLDYRPNRAARSLRKRESKLVGLRVNPATAGRAGSLFDRFLHALVEHSVGAGYHILLFTPTDPANELSGFNDLLATTTVDAFVLTDTHHGDRRLEWLQRQQARFVAFGRPWETSQHAWVDVDGAAGTGAAVHHLVELGHRRIGYVGWPAGSDVGADRQRGWSDAVTHHGLDTNGLLANCEDTTDSGVEAGGLLLDSPEPPTALVCASDTLAMGVFAAMAHRGLVPGSDVAVTGFDDSPTAAVVPGGLTSVRQPLEDAAQAIVKRLEAILRDGEPADQGELLTPTLVVRGSTRGADTGNVKETR